MAPIKVDPDKVRDGNERVVRPRLSDAAFFWDTDLKERLDARVNALKTFTFQDYYRTMAFVNALAFVAHREDHHPDLGVHYDRCVVRYSTHDVGGLSENDFICAAKAERLAG